MQKRRFNEADLPWFAWFAIVHGCRGPPPCMMREPMIPGLITEALLMEQGQEQNTTTFSV
jgi:hypothetical protein